MFTLEHAASLASNTYNHLYGFQLAHEATAYDSGGPLQINCLCKAGIFGNSVGRDIRRLETDAVGFPVVDEAR